MFNTVLYRNYFIGSCVYMEEIISLGKMDFEKLVIGYLQYSKKLKRFREMHY